MISGHPSNAADMVCRLKKGVAEAAASSRSPNDLATAGTRAMALGRTTTPASVPMSTASPRTPTSSSPSLNSAAITATATMARCWMLTATWCPQEIIGPLLLDAKERGILKAVTSHNGMMTTGASETPTEHLAVSGPGESPPFVQRLDFRQDLTARASRYGRQVHDSQQVEVAPGDLRIDVIISDSTGRESALRVTHIPTGLTVTVDDYPTQIENRVHRAHTAW